MKFRRSILETFASLALAVTPASAGPRGYLPMAGPAPLRFSSGARPDRVELPPLAPPTQPVVPSEPTTGTETPDDSEAEVAPAVTTTEERSIPATQPESELPEEGATPDSTAPTPEARTAAVPSSISPQQLITYFTAEPGKPTRPTKPRVRPTVIAPVTFVPPSPGQKSVSQATYSTGN